MYQKYLKRTFDTTISLIVLMIAIPVGIVVALLIKLDSRGPAIFKQKRTGLHGKTFHMYKFRTMTCDNNVHDTKQENKLTTLGKIIRALSLDEIPQFVNVIKGDMAFIGPRPWIPEYYQHMTEEQRKRNSVRPGITGLAQARGRNDLSVFDKIHYDLLYIQKITFTNDVKIVVLTLLELFKRTGEAIDKLGIHHEINTLKLQHSNKLATDSGAFYSELPKDSKEVGRIKRKKETVSMPAKTSENIAVKSEAIPRGNKKVLFTATVDSHILAFHIPYLQYFKDQGYEVHVATNGDADIPFCDVKHVVPFERSPFKPNNLKAIRQLKKIIDTERFDIIHTHTPMGSVVTRLAAMHARKKFNTRVIYTAHGFHFFKGAPMLNWIIFYPVEKLLAYKTDTLITINKEDYDLAKKKFKTDVQYVPGVGIDTEKFDKRISENDKQKLRKDLNITVGDFVIIFPAELNVNKNQILLIDALEIIIKTNPNTHLLLPGKDSLNGYHSELINTKKLENNVHLLGFRKDIPELLSISNLAVSSSLREGLPVNIMEANYVGLPIIATDCRGNRDLVQNGYNGYLVDTKNSLQYADKIIKLMNDKKLYTQFSDNAKNVARKYTLNRVLNKFINIYGIARQGSNSKSKMDDELNINSSPKVIESYEQAQ